MIEQKIYVEEVTYNAKSRDRCKDPAHTRRQWNDNNYSSVKNQSFF